MTPDLDAELRALHETTACASVNCEAGGVCCTLEALRAAAAIGAAHERGAIRSTALIMRKGCHEIVRDNRDYRDGYADAMGELVEWLDDRDTDHLKPGGG